MVGVQSSARRVTKQQMTEAHNFLQNYATHDIVDQWTVREANTAGKKDSTQHEPSQPGAGEPDGTIQSNVSIHRIALPIRWDGPYRDAERRDDTALALCCASTNPCNNAACVEECCAQRGISVTTVEKSGAGQVFRAAHQVLIASRLHATLCNTTLGRQHIAWHATPNDMAQAVTEEELNEMVSEAFRDGNLCSFPTCAVRSSAPANVRIISDPDQVGGRQHMLLQPTQNMSAFDVAKVALALGDGWTVCPFNLRGGAGDDYLDTLEDGTPPTPRSRLAGAVSETLTRLLAARCKMNLSNEHELFELAYTLCRLPEEEPIDLSQKPHLCHCLLQAYKLGAVDPFVPGYDDMLTALCRAVGKPPEEIDMRHIQNEQRPSRSLAILGDLLICWVVPGQKSKREEELNEVDERAQRCLDGEPDLLDKSSNIKELINDSLYWSRARQARYTHFKCSTHGVEEGEIVYYDDFKAKAADVKVVVPGTEIDGAICQLSEKSLREFCRLAAQPNYDHIDGDFVGTDALSFLRGGEPAPKAHLQLSKLLRDKEVSFHSCSGSVVSVLQGLDSSSLDSMKKLLNDRHNGLATFIVAYLSCKLRKAAGEHEGILPLATDALLIETTGIAVAPSIEPVSGIVPPSLKHETFLVAIELGRQDIGYMHGRLMATSLVKGVHLLRRLHSLRSSFLLWFVENLRTFRLSSAFFRTGANSEDDASLWSSRLLGVTRESLASVGLVAKVDGIAAADKTRKFVFFVGWSQQMLDIVLPQVMNMLKLYRHVNPSVVLNLRVTGLDTETPAAGEALLSEEC